MNARRSDCRGRVLAHMVDVRLYVSSARQSYLSLLVMMQFFLSLA